MLSQGQDNRRCMVAPRPNPDPGGPAAFSLCGCPVWECVQVTDDARVNCRTCAALIAALSEASR